EGMAAVIFWTGSCTPMIPVEEERISFGAALMVRARSLQTLRAARSPGRPVAQLALPAFTITARTLPLEAARRSRPTMSGAATTWLRVNIAAAEAPFEARANARSGLPLALMPAAHAENRNPWGSASGLTLPASRAE